jgi:hypothetical protein
MSNEAKQNILDWKDGEGGYCIVSPNGAFSLGISIIGGVGFNNAHAKAVLSDVKTKLNTYDEMLEALKVVNAQLCYMAAEHGAPLDGPVNEAYKQARAIISKAGGR